MHLLTRIVPESIQLPARSPSVLPGRQDSIAFCKAPGDLPLDRHTAIADPKVAVAPPALRSLREWRNHAPFDLTKLASNLEGLPQQPIILGQILSFVPEIEALATGVTRTALIQNVGPLFASSA